MLQFARLESLLQQAARSPGRQSWKADGEDQVRAATGDLSHCCMHAPSMLPFSWCTLCLCPGVLFAVLLVYSLPFCWCTLCLSPGVLFAFHLVYCLPFCWCTLCLSPGVLFACGVGQLSHCWTECPCRLPVNSSNLLCLQTSCIISQPAPSSAQNLLNILPWPELCTAVLHTA